MDSRPSKNIRIVNNSFSDKITNQVVLITRDQYDAVSLGFTGRQGSIADIINKSEVPFDWEPK